MAYPYTRQHIYDLVQAPKVVRENTQLVVSGRGEAGATFDVNLDVVDGAFVDLRYLGKAADHCRPPT